MHELSICQAIADTVVGRAGGQRVARVTVRIGHLRQVVPDALTFSWEMLTSDQAELAGAELEVEQVEATVACRSCGEVTALDMPILVCGACGDPEVEVRSGDELLLVSFERAALDGARE